MNISGLIDYQVPAAAQLLDAQCTYGGALDGSDMGVGKTAHACAVIRERNVPTLVVCPAVSVSSWRRMGDLLNTRFSILNYEALRTGRTDFGRWNSPGTRQRPEILICTSCQQKFNNPTELHTRKCPHHYLGIHCIEVKKKPHDYGPFHWHPNIKQLVFDEVHRCAALDSLQSRMLVAAKRARIPTLGLSATAAESPLDLRGLGYVLGLHSYTDFYRWAAQRGCRKTTWGGFQFLVGDEKRRTIMEELHRDIFPSRGARVRIADLGDKFPAVQIKAELYDLAGSGKIDELYAEMDTAIQVLNGIKEADLEHPLTKLLRARQEIELITLPIYEEIIPDAIRSGRHVAVFLNFVASVEELAKRLKTQCRVDGSQRGEKGAAARQKCVDNFQADREPVIICSPAGTESLSLHDVRGCFPRLGLVSPGYSSRGFRQIMGRLRRQGGRSTALYRVLFIAGTVQEKIYRAVVPKLDCLDTLNDGDLAAANLPLTKCSWEDITKSE